jgi:hypothetical protein
VSSPPPSPGAPFSSTPIEPAQRPGGCARAALIGCGVAAILVLILLGVFTAYVKRKPEALTDLLMGQVERNLAPDVSEREKADLRSAYAEFRQGLQERRAGAEPLDRLRRILSGATSGAISREQARALTEDFRRAASSGPTPAPAPAARPGAASPPAPARTP